MTLSRYEELRIQNIEEQIIVLQKQLRGAASKNQLNRLLVLANEEVRKLTVLNTSLQTKVDELIELTEKLQ